MKNTTTKQNVKKHLLVLLTQLPLFMFAQLSITTNTIATSLAQTIVGSGVSVGNANLNCGIHASGTFTDTGTDLGLSKGIILTTGYATEAGGPSVFANYNENTHGVPTYSDPYLTATGGPNAKYDVCILTFTFVPVCNSVDIQYVFGSEEYPEYINSFNDALGIFLDGPNPSGGNYTGTNIATLTNGHNTSVSIDSVNGGYSTAQGATTTIPASNPSYYVNNYSNSGGSTSPGANGDISYHGYTIPITSSAAVTPCQTYTMEIAIADGGNGNYDSGVFIQGGSTGCSSASTPSITASSTPSGCVGNTGSATVTVTNYTGTPSYAWSSGITQTTNTVSGLTPNTYTCTVSFPGFGCGSVYTQSISVTVSPSSVSVPTFSSSSVSPSCGNNSGGASVSVANFSGTPTYSWSPGGQTSSSISGLSAGTYSCLIGVLGCSSTTYTTIVVPVLNTGTVVSASFSVNPSTGNAPLVVTLTNTSFGASNYSWDFGNGNMATSINTTTTYTNPGTYTIVLAAYQGTCSTIYTETVIVTEPLSHMVIPNIFSPNGDQINDLFAVTAVGISTFSCEIYDRWGLEMFDSNQLTTSWDGKNKKNDTVPDGIYFYIIKAKGIDAKDYTCKGFLTLIR